MSDKEKSNFDNVHWADNSAQRVIDTFPNEKIYTVASGITPSGIIHVGHFREVITTELVRRALEKKGKKTNFIYSWDSYDAFRKVPQNVPEEWSKYLRLPDADVPDPFDNKHENFAEHFMQQAEESLSVFDFPINFQRQHKIQTSGVYANGIKEHLKNRDKIKPLLDKYRKEPLAKDWLPLTVYCEGCGKDTTTISNYDEEYTLDYVCNSCNHSNTINFKDKPIVKLPWRLDWPMRWAHYDVSFEPGGKDHSTPGGSYDTGCEIIKLISKRDAPVYTFYNFVSMKGMGGKISSSTGIGATIADVLKIYTPELVMFLFAGTRPNAEFDISFDLDVIKIYEDFDKLERLYFGVDVEKNEKKLATQKRMYELSMVGDCSVQKDIPYQPSFRHLVNVAQACDFDFKKVVEFYGKNIKNDYDLNRLKSRFECVKFWLENYAPEDMVFNFQKNIGAINDVHKKLLIELREGIGDITESKELGDLFKNISTNNNLEMKDFFVIVYKVIIGKEKGPRLSSLVMDNKNTVLELLKQIK